MPTPVKCPKCAAVLDVENMLSADVEEKLKRHYEQQFQQSLARLDAEKQKLEQEQKHFEARRKREAEAFEEKLAQEKKKLEAELQLQLRKTIALDYDNELRLLKQNIQENEARIKAAREKEYLYLKKEQELKSREQELEIELQKKLMAERQLLAQQIRKEEADRNANKDTEHQLEVRELKKQLEDQRKLAEEMKRRAEQGSMQLQGEVQELLLEDLLRTSFPFDAITEVGKGVRGADCIQTVRNNFGQECGKIIFESKRTQAFSAEWIEKLKRDMRTTGSDIAVIVTTAMPKDMDCFGLRDGVWICCFSEVKALAGVLRDAVIRVFNAAKSHEHRGDKVNLLYSYLTSNEFSEQWKAIREGFLEMKISIQKERDAMEKLWKSREKHLEKVLLSAAHIKGSIEGIAGQNTIDFDLDDEEDESPKIPKLSFK
jgi:hypothetical protein